jgi:ATP adenylyltransferase
LKKKRDKKAAEEKGRPLWAPWRIDYILSSKDGECFLCGKEKKTGGQDDLVIYRGKKVFVILNMFPYNSGHLIIAPYRHIKLFSQMADDERHEFSDVTALAEKMLTKGMRPDGFNIGFNIGKAAGAGVEQHIHLHVVPRWAGDVNFMPVISNTRVVPQSLVDTAAILRKKWKK